MRVLILLHSSTGNTRVVTRFAAAHLRKLGVECVIHDVGWRHEAPDIDGFDAVGVAFPVMYFWPTLTLINAVERLLPPGNGRPAFVLATAAGDPGAGLAMAAEQLQDKGYTPPGTHWMLAPSNFPTHLAPLRFIRKIPLLGRVHRAMLGPLGSLWRRFPTSRRVAGLLWLEAMEPTERDRAELERFMDKVYGQIRVVQAGGKAWPTDLFRGLAEPFVWMGRFTKPQDAIKTIGWRVHADRCTACGSCVTTCPEDCITLADGGVPVFGPGCVGCFACYNACAFSAIACNYTPAGVGRYEGPPLSMRRLFKEK